MDVGSKIKQLRLQRNITQAELGKKICKSKSSVEKYESGETAITIDLLQDIAKALNVNVVNFFTEDADDILILIKDRFNLKDNSKGQLEYDFNILIEVLKTKYR